jgi:hypothetical protein
VPFTGQTNGDLLRYLAEMAASLRGCDVAMQALREWRDKADHVEH